MKKITNLILLMLCAFAGYGQISGTGFETGVPPGWVITNDGAGFNRMRVVNDATSAHGGTSSISVTPSAATPLLPAREILITSAIDLTSTINPKISFYAKNTGSLTPNTTRNSKLEIRVSTTDTNLASFNIPANLISTYQDYSLNAPNPVSPTLGQYGLNELSLLPYAGQTIYIAFVVVNEGTGRSWWFDDISIQDTCPGANDLTTTNITATSATASWLNPFNLAGFEIDVMLASETPTSFTPDYTSITGTSQILSNLIPNTAYKYYIRSVCGNNFNSDWVGPNNFTTIPPVEPLTYIENFESNHGWQFINGTQVNKWFVGTATNNGGVKSLYISNNDGVDNTYTTSTTSVTHAYKDISINSGIGQIEVSFDWKASGESTYDYLRVWLVPTTFTPVAGTQITALAGERIQIGGNLNQQINWLRSNYIINLTAAMAGTNRRLVFEWRNDSSSGTQPPAAVDNLMVKAITCSQPTNLVLGTVAQNTAVVSWTAPTVSVPSLYEYFVSQTNTPPADNATPDGTVTTTTVTLTGLQPGQIYYVWVRGNCGTVNGNSNLLGPLTFSTSQSAASLPYTENFDAPGVVFGLINGTQPNKWTVGNDTFSSPGNSLYISDNTINNTYNITSSSTTFAYRDINIPAGITQLQISFDWKAAGQGSTDKMRVWLVPATTILTPGTSILTGGQRIQIAGDYSGNTNWTTVNNVINIPATVAGTTSRLVFEWINNATTGTQPPAAVDNIIVKELTCGAPTNLVLNSVGSDNAQISWTAPTTLVPPAYDYYFSTNNTPPTDATPSNGTVTTPNATLTGLQPNQTYYVWVRGNCGGPNGNSYLLGPLVVVTTQIPAPLPYNESFDIPGFVFSYNNGTQVNKWMVGTDTFLSPGNSLYISNNQVNNTYTTTTTSVTQAYRDISIDAGAGEMEISFDWKGQAESCCDYFRVWLVPTTFTPTTGAQITALAGQRIQIGGNFNQQIDWVNYMNTIDVSAFAGTDRRLVFEWRNDSSGGTQPPAAIDNLKVKILTCSAPTTLTLVSVTESTATITWNGPVNSAPDSYDYFVSLTNTPPTDATVPTGSTPLMNNMITLTGLLPNTTYYFWVRGNCGLVNGNSNLLGPLTFNTTQIPAQLPYTENFDTPGFVFGFNNGQQVNKWIVGNDTFLSPGNSLYISNNNINNAYTISTASVTQAYRDVFIPANVLEAQLSFDWKAQGESSFDYLRVWLVPATFTPTPGTQITTANSNGVQIGGNYNTRNTWQNVSVPVNVLRFQNTSARIIFEWRNDGSGGTQPPAAVDNISFIGITCPAPTNLNAELSCADATMADISWSPGNVETSWQYAVLPANSPQPTTGTVVSVPEAVVSDLDPNSDYSLWVRAICGGAEGNSVWVRYNFESSASPVATANPFCAGPEGIVFPNVHDDMGVPNLVNGQFHCLYSTPNPVWYYLKVDQGGQLNFQIVQNTEFNAQGQPTGRTLDVDYVAFGPFEDLEDACSTVIIDQGSSPNPDSLVVGCSFSGAAVENFSISNAQPGQVYALLITNYNRQPGFIKLVQTNAGQPGAGNTDCNFLCEVDLGQDRVFCDKDSHLLKATVHTISAGAVTSIQWFFNGVLMDPAIYNTLQITVTESGEYSIIIERENCELDEPITDSVNLLFATTFKGEIAEKLTSCDYDNDGLALFDLDAFAQSFLLNSNEFTVTFHGSLEDANANENPLTPIYESGAGSIFVRIVDANNLSTCVRVEEIELEVLPSLIAVVEFNYSEPICVNNENSISPILVDDFTFGGVFSSSNGLIIDRNTGEIDLDNSISGDYIVNYKFEIPEGMCGRSEEFSTNVKILDRIGFIIDGYCKGGVFTLSATDILGTLDFSTATFKWSGGVLKSEGPVATLDKPGKYTLTVTTADGCFETAEIDISDIYCQIPKGVSPNADGLNDNFVLNNLNVQRLEIFNRYGKEVYSHGAGYTNQWQGQSNSGGELPSGTYFYNIVTPFENFTGWIQLVRE